MRLILRHLSPKLSQFNISSLLAAVVVAVVNLMMQTQKALVAELVVIAQAYRVNHLAAAQAQSQR
jgi:hypothetical protein